MGMMMMSSSRILISIKTSFHVTWIEYKKCLSKRFFAIYKLYEKKHEIPETWKIDKV